tara:strand:+ start:31 stop:516 length:486 start_codon:yes stop_codon:yes gene_type:complete
MDDDDCYVPNYVVYTTGILLKTFKKGIGLVGSNQMLFIYPHDNYKVSGISCTAVRQIHEGTMCYHKKYINSMGGYSRSSKAEGARLIDGSENRCSNLNIFEQMICTCHDDNTIEKSQFKSKKLPFDFLEELQKLPQFEILQHIFQKKYDPTLEEDFETNEN